MSTCHRFPIIIVVLQALIGPGDLTADIQTAQRLLAEGKVIEALYEIDGVLRANPDDPEIQFQAGVLLRRLGADRVARLRQLAPDSPEAHELMGESLESRGELDEALAEYRAAMKIRPDSAGL